MPADFPAADVAAAPVQTTRFSLYIFAVVRKAGRFRTKIKSCFFFLSLSLKIRFPIAVERPEAVFGSAPTTEAKT